MSKSVEAVAGASAFDDGVRVLLTFCILRDIIKYFESEGGPEGMLLQREDGWGAEMGVF